MNLKSRHPKIHYWFWDENTITDKQYLKDIDTLADKSDFDLIFLTQRGSLNFWNYEMFKPKFAEMVEYAHKRGLKIGLQIWPQGFFAESTTEIKLDEAEAFVTEYEAELSTEKLVIEAHGKNVRNIKCSPALKSELLYAAAFKKTGEGFYEEGSLVDITGDITVQENENDLEALTLTLRRKDLDGYTVYAMVAHYYKYGEMFGEVHQNDYKNLIDSYADIPFDGFGLDEFKHLSVLNPMLTELTFRERIYGKAFEKAYKEQKGENLVKTMFQMRYCPEGKDDIRIKAINDYWAIYRPSTVRVEKFVADYAKKVFGEDVFVGVHNTYHNMLQNDELWMTGCNWWDIPRKYAQTDEDIGYPVRAGMACGCPESIVYDMFYNPKEDTFFEKAVRDARYNSRIHYHAMNDGYYGVNTGSEDFLGKIGKIESKINLLNIFDTKQPKMELLVVFGFPALCNWYPDYSARNNVDINGKLNILSRTNALWNNGYFNALAPSNAVEDGRITLKDGKFDYCGHSFSKLLYLYPEYSKPAVVEFLKDAANSGCDMKIIGELARGFDGKPASLEIGKEIFIGEDADIPKVMSLKQNTIKNGCVTEDGSVVISDYDSVMNDGFATYEFELDGYRFEAEFRGTLALKLDSDGGIEKLAAGNLKYLKKDGETLLELDGKEDYLNI